MKKKRILALIMVLAFVMTFMVTTTSAAPATKQLKCLHSHSGIHVVDVHYDDAALQASDISLSWDDNGDEIIEPESYTRRVYYDWFSGWPSPPSPEPGYVLLPGYSSGGFLFPYRVYTYSLEFPNPPHVGIFTVDVDDSNMTAGYQIQSITLDGSPVSVPFEIESPCYDGTGAITWNVNINLNVLATFESDDGTSTQWVAQGGTPTPPVIEDSLFNGWSPAVGAITVPTTFTAQYLTPDPELTMTKTADVDSGLVTGNTVSYEFVISNTGNVTVTGINLSDSGATFDPDVTDIGDLAPGESSTVYGEYTITESDMFNEGYTNTASATGEYDGNPVSTGPVTEEVTTAGIVKSISLKKDANPDSGFDLGNEVEYVFTIENTGNVTLSGVTITDPDVDFGGLNIFGTFMPGDILTSAAIHVVTEADLWNVDIVNNATVSGYTIEREVITADATKTVSTVGANPELTLTKSGVTNNGNDINDVIEYTITVENTGNVTIDNIVITDPLIPSLTGGAVGSLAPGESAQATGSYTIVESDIWENGVFNIATAEGVDKDQQVIMTTAGAEVKVAMVNPSLELKKESDAGDAVLEIGDQVEYTFTLKNIGNVTLTDVDVVDAAIGFDLDDTVTLAPGEELELTAKGIYTILEEDSYNGLFANTATATALYGETAIEPVDSNEVIVAVIAPFPNYIFIKTALTDTTPAPVGSEIIYQFTIINNGTVTWYNASVSDPIIGFESESVDIIPGESYTWTAENAYIVDEIDSFNGSLTNTAYASAYEADANEPVSVSASATVDVVDANASLSIVKTVDAASVYVGETLNYTVTVTNDGNVNLYDGRMVDELLGIDEFIFNTLVPGDSVIVEGFYETTSDDRPSVTNIAQVWAYDYSGHEGGEGDIVGPPNITLNGDRGLLNGPFPNDGPLYLGETHEHYAVAEVTSEVSYRPAPNMPGINVIITPDNALVEVGTDVVFTITISNTGNAVLNNVAVVDTDLGVNVTIPTLFVTGSESFTATKTMDTAGNFSTTVTATGSTSGASVSSVSDTDTTVVKVNETTEEPQDPDEPEIITPPTPTPVPLDVPENPQTGAIPFDAYSVTGLLAMGTGLFALITRKKEDDENEQN